MNKLVKYLKEAREEFHKVTWPTRTQTIRYSLLVVGISVFLAVFIGFVDYALNVGVEQAIDATTEPLSFDEFSDFDLESQGIQVTTEPVTDEAVAQ